MLFTSCSRVPSLSFVLHTVVCTDDRYMDIDSTSAIPLGLTAVRAYAISGRSLSLAVAVFLLGLVSPVVDIVRPANTSLIRIIFLI